MDPDPATLTVLLWSHQSVGLVTSPDVTLLPPRSDVVGAVVPSDVPLDVPGSLGSPEKGLKNWAHRPVLRERDENQRFSQMDHPVVPVGTYQWFFTREACWSRNLARQPQLARWLIERPGLAGDFPRSHDTSHDTYLVPSLTQLSRSLWTFYDMLDRDL